MKESKKDSLDWLFIIFFLGVIISGLTYGGIRDHKVNKFMKGIQPGDRFERIYTEKDPFADTLKVTGVILDKRGSYIQYINDKTGDTTSMEIRSAIYSNKVRIIK